MTPERFKQIIVLAEKDAIGISRQDMEHGTYLDRKPDVPDEYHGNYVTDQFNRMLGLEMLLSESGPIILEPGCGDGGILGFLLDRGFACQHYIGLDNDPVMIARATDRYSPQRVKADFVLRDFTLPDLWDDLHRQLGISEIQTVILSQVLEHLDMNQIMPTIAELLQGCVRNMLITVPNIRAYPTLLRHCLVPDQMTWMEHRTFFTPKLLENCLNQALEMSGKVGMILIQEFMRFAEFTGEDCFYHIMGRVVLE